MVQTRLRLKLLPDVFGILKLPDQDGFPDWLVTVWPYFVARTEDEFSVMCPQVAIPAGLDCSRDWRCLRVDGELAFDEVGVAARLARPLADAGLSIFVVSTHDRDYVFVSEPDLRAALAVYTGAGFILVDA